MYIALYDENQKHLTNIDNVSFDATTRVYDNDSFSAEGVSDEDVNNAKILVLNDDIGTYKYACFVNEIKPEYNKRTIKGLDFKSLWDTEILIDYTAENSFDGKLSAIFEKIKNLVFDTADMQVTKIPVKVIIPNDDTDTTEMYGSYQGTYQITNAYKFLKCYLKYYEYNIESYYDIVNCEIVFKFVKCQTALDIDLNDFIYELTTTSNATNKAVATIKFEPSDDVTERPNTIAEIYYYRDKNNNIIQSDKFGNIPNRLYPVQQKLFEAEYLADSQFEAVYELANARYVDNIVIDNNLTIDPIDFADYPLYTKVNLYYEGKLYKVLPISEKITTFDGGGLNTKIKLGFKKILLTEIIKN